MNIDRDIKKAKLLAPLLYELYNKSEQGIFGQKDMPEDLLPNSVSKGSFEHLMFITMVTAIDYQRDANQLWDAGRKTMDDRETSWIFNPREVLLRSNKNLVDALKIYKLSKKDVKDALHIWKPVSLSLSQLYHGDPRNLFNECEYDALRIFDVLKGRYKSHFPFLSGNKILPLWIRMLHDVVGIDFKNIDKIPIPVDRHIARATLRLGCLIGFYQGPMDGIFRDIDKVWAEACKDTPYYRLQLDQPLWNLSKYGCIYNKGSACPRKNECSFSEYCIDGEIIIDDQGLVKMKTDDLFITQKQQVSNEKSTKDMYQWCPTTKLLWTACTCPRCSERKNQSRQISTIVNEEENTKTIDFERLWKDVCQFVDKKIKDGDTIMYTNSQNKKFWVISITSSYIRVEREKSKLPYEDIPKGDFIDIWRDLHNPRFITRGYSQKDLHGGQNRHTAVSFTLISKIPYITSKEVGGGLRYFIKKRDD